MILKLKKILFVSPNPSFLLKLCETKINQICFLETIICFPKGGEIKGMN